MVVGLTMHTTIQAIKQLSGHEKLYTTNSTGAHVNTGFTSLFDYN